MALRNVIEVFFNLTYNIDLSTHGTFWISLQNVSVPTG